MRHSTGERIPHTHEGPMLATKFRPPSGLHLFISILSFFLSYLLLLLTFSLIPLLLLLLSPTAPFWLFGSLILDVSTIMFTIPVKDSFSYFFPLQRPQYSRSPIGYNTTSKPASFSLDFYRRRLELLREEKATWGFVLFSSFSSSVRRWDAVAFYPGLRLLLEKKDSFFRASHERGYFQNNKNHQHHLHLELLKKKKWAKRWERKKRGVTGWFDAVFYPQKKRSTAG